MMGEDWLPVLTVELGSDSFFATVNPRRSQLEQDFPTFCNRRSHFQLKWLARNPEQQVWVSRLHRAWDFPCLCSFCLYFSTMPVFNLQKYCLDFTQDFRWVSALSVLCSIFWTSSIRSSISSGTWSDFQDGTWFSLYLGHCYQEGPHTLTLGQYSGPLQGCRCSVLLSGRVQVCPSSAHNTGWVLGWGSWFQPPRFIIIFVQVFWLNSVMALAGFPQYTAKAWARKSRLKSKLHLFSLAYLHQNNNVWENCKGNWVFISFSIYFMGFFYVSWCYWASLNSPPASPKDSGSSDPSWLALPALLMGHHGFTPCFPLLSPWTSRLSTSCFRDNMQNSSWDDTETRHRFKIKADLLHTGDWTSTSVLQVPIAIHVEVCRQLPHRQMLHWLARNLWTVSFTSSTWFNLALIYDHIERLHCAEHQHRSRELRS